MNNHCMIINNEVFEILPKHEYTKDEEKLFDLIWSIFVAEQWANYFKAALNRMEIA